MATLPAGTRIGPYQLLSVLGVGGMGEVYRARDPRLQRDVAIKVLAHAGADRDRQRRFAEEAQAASALNHPNIVTVYDVGVHDGTPYIVSEIVDGTSVRGVLTRASRPIRDMLDLAAQMADGLAAAHSAGIVHRDFKPENVMVTRDGRVKILDFGLALVGTRDGLSAAEAADTMTVSGLIVGTVPYMSPEQARGAAVDYRTDQFSFGLTLYEMISGRRAFSAETPAQILAKIIEDEPEPIATLNPRVPAPARWLVERCLAKDPRHRYDATADLARELHTLRDRLNEVAPVAELPPVAPGRRRWIAAAIAVAAAIAGIGLLIGLTDEVTAPPLAGYRFAPFATDAGFQGSPAWSPDGKTIAYVADVDGVLQVFTRSLASTMRVQVTHARFHCRDPFWAPDGTRLYFISLARDRDGLWSISAAGGEAELVMENIQQAALSPDSRTLAFFRNAEDGRALYVSLWFSSPPGSAPVQYVRPPFGARRGYGNSTLHFAPDGSKLGAWVTPYAGDAANAQAEFWVIPLGDEAPYAAPPLSADLPGITAFSWFPDSRRVLTALPYPRPGVHLWVTDTRSRRARPVLITGGVENDPSISPDGTRLALTLQQADYDVVELAVDRRAPTTVLTTSLNEMDPTWSPAASALAFTTDRSGQEEIWLRSQRGEFERPLVTPGDFGGDRPYHLLAVPAFSSDGRRIAFTRQGPEGNRIWLIPVAGGPPVRLTDFESVQDSPSWSPNADWIAYVQSARGDWSLTKMRVGSRTAPQNLASGVFPFSPVQWSPDGSWIAYDGRDGLSIVSPDGQSSRVLHELSWAAFTWSADGQRLFGLRESDDFRHLTFSSIDVRTGVERVLSANVMPMPLSGQPVRGFTRVTPTTFLTSIAHVRSDVWLLDGFERPPTARDRLRALVPWRW